MGLALGGRDGDARLQRLGRCRPLPELYFGPCLLEVRRCIVRVAAQRLLTGSRRLGPPLERYALQADAVVQERIAGLRGGELPKLLQA